MKYLRLQFSDVLSFHVANEGVRGSRGKIYGAHKKLEGVVPGIPDILILHSPTLNGKTYNGVAIELKRQGGRISDSQKKVLTQFKDAGWYTSVIWSFEEFVDTVNYVFGYE